MRKLALGLCMLASPTVAQEFRLGSPVADFEIVDLTGKAVRYSALKGDTTVVMFVGTACPISNAYNERMKALYNDYSPKGVHFIFINANNSEPASEVETHAKAHSFPFPVYKDRGNVVADRFGAQVTPESFVIDSAGVIRYHGYIDDAQNEARVKNRGLRTALEAVLDGKSVMNGETKAFGCTIKRRRKTT
jgi:peroxiredoxin